MNRIHIMNPYFLKDDIDFVFPKRLRYDTDLPKRLKHAHAKGDGGGGSSKEYERQLAEQRAATEKAEAEAKRLKEENDAAARRRKDRQGASLLTPDEGQGDVSGNIRKSVLGSGN